MVRVSFRMERDMDFNLETLLKSREELGRLGGRDVLAKAHRFEIADILRGIGLYPYYCELERNEGAVAVLGGREVLMLGSNNYLALTTHPEVRAAAEAAIRDLGTSMTGSRLLNGTARYHAEFEAEIAEFVGKEAALVSSTGYQANIGVLSGLLGGNGVAVLDRFCHASLVDGCRVAGTRVVYFRHNDAADLDRVLAEVPAETPALVVVDGVYSMEGDVADLPRIVEVARRHRTRVLLDDAHGIGVLGPGGRGTAAHFGLTGEVDLIVGTFSKSLASVGGFVAGDARAMDYVKHFGRSFVFSASAPPGAVGAARAALAVLKREPLLVERLHRNAEYWREGLRRLGLDVARSSTPICPVVIGQEVTTLAVWKDLLDAGVFVNPVLYPAVPRNRAMLRTSVTAAHTTDQLDRALEAFREVAEVYGLGAGASSSEGWPSSVA